ncbi:hypothetical protein [Salinibacterium amurskyense]|nr:hypothetical protein [Salinibacterium amurskyense]
MTKAFLDGSCGGQQARRPGGAGGATPGGVERIDRGTGAIDTAQKLADDVAKKRPTGCRLKAV